VNPFTVLASPIEWLITGIYDGIKHVPVLADVGAFGIAVIVTTLIIRTILFPLFAWQLRNSRRMQEQQRIVGPAIAQIRKQYKGQPQKMTEEMQKVYREHNMSPFSGLSGCLPMIVQLPVIYSLYNGIRGAVATLVSTHGQRPDVHFLWTSDVSQSASDLSNAHGIAFPANLVAEFAHPWVLIIPLMAAAATFVQSRMMMQPPRPDMTSQERSMYNLSRQMSFFLPVMIFVLALGFPVGIALYWVTQSSYMVIQQYYMLGWGGMKVPGWMPGAARQTSLSYSPTPRGAAGAAGNNGKAGKTDKPDATVVVAGVPEPPPPATVGGPARAKPSRSARARKRRR
jgi:YidC/Oxa1 family membrane protein insertase